MERLQIFERLAARVDSAWEAKSYDPEAFAGISADLVEEERGAIAFATRDPIETLRWASTAPWPEQVLDNGYGQATFALGRTPRLRVELIFWKDGIADVHGHVRPGIFSVLHGERMHASYDFDVKDSSTPGLHLGDLRLTNIELLGPGDLRKIEPDNRTIHSLVFLGRPCVTLSIRAANNPPWFFDSDHLFVDASVPRVSEKWLFKGYNLFVELRPEELVPLAKDVLLRKDVDVLFAKTLLSGLRPRLAHEDFVALRTIARDRFGEWIDKLLVSSHEWLRRTVLAELLGDPAWERGPRMLLGLAWMSPDKNVARAFLERAYPGEDPIGLVDRWRVAITGPRSPSEEFAASLGMAPEDEVSALLRQLRKRLA